MSTHTELIAALRDLVIRCDGEEGVRADGSNIQTMRAHAILEKLTERDEVDYRERERIEWEATHYMCVLMRPPLHQGRAVTPGPWIQDGRMVVANGDAVAMVNIARPVESAHADARLIAAAPDLLAALELALAGITQARRPEWDEYKTVATIRAALAKAKGEV